MPFWRRAKPRRSGEDAGPPARERGPDEALPDFRYFPDPLAAGVFVESDSSCDFCGAARGFVYVGPLYALEEYVACPWCIADGSAAASSLPPGTDRCRSGAAERSLAGRLHRGTHLADSDSD